MTHRPNRFAQQVLRRGGDAAALALLGLALFSGGVGAQEEAETSDQSGTASLAGVVVDARTRLPLRGARIEVEGHADVATSASDGRFALFDVPAGRRELRIALGGRSTRPQAVDLPASRHTEVRIAIIVPAGDPAPDRVIPLPPLEVEITASDHASKMRGFFERARSGRGTFITREDIERRHPGDTADLLRDVPGVRVSVARGGRHVVSTNRGCRLSVFLDGLPVPGLNPSEIPPQDIEALEVYRSVIETPPRFRARSGCGALVVWTRDPGRS